MNPKCVSTPCPECPFSRACKPGDLGGSPWTKYVGQVAGPFWLPCHAHSDFDDPNWKTDYSKPQCCGAATFRTHVNRVNPKLASMPANHTLVFSSFEEFVSHHLNIPPSVASKLLELYPPDLLMLSELGQTSNHYIKPS